MGARPRKNPKKPVYYAVSYSKPELIGKSGKGPGRIILFFDSSVQMKIADRLTAGKRKHMA